MSMVGILSRMTHQTNKFYIEISAFTIYIKVYELELWVTSLSDTPCLQYYDVQTLEYRYISKLPMKNERTWSYVKETTSHLQNKLTKNIHLGIATSTRPPFSWKYKLNYLPF